MTSTKYIGMDVHKEGISMAVMNSVGKLVMECVIDTKASTICFCTISLRFFAFSLTFLANSFCAR